jgi:uncharacterized protein (TIGR04141 family)
MCFSIRSRAAAWSTGWTLPLSGPAGQFVCIRNADSTAPLNHLFAQGLVAIETLRYDHEAREKFLASSSSSPRGMPWTRHSARQSWFSASS